MGNQKKFISNKIRIIAKGNGVTIFGVFLILLCFVFIFVMLQIFSMFHKSVTQQLAADALSDGVALYMVNDGEDYNDALNFAHDLAGSLKSSAGIDVGSMSMDYNAFSTEDIVSINVSRSDKTGGGSLISPVAFQLKAHSATHYQKSVALDKKAADKIFWSMSTPSRDKVYNGLLSLGIYPMDAVGCIAWVVGEADYSADPYLGYLSAMAIINLCIQGGYGGGRLQDIMYGWGGGNDFYSKEHIKERFDHPTSSALKCLYMALSYPLAGISECRGIGLGGADSTFYVSYDVMSEGQPTGVWRNLPWEY